MYIAYPPSVAVAVEDGAPNKQCAEQRLPLRGVAVTSEPASEKIKARLVATFMLLKFFSAYQHILIHGNAPAQTGTGATRLRGSDPALDDEDRRFQVLHGSEGGALQELDAIRGNLHGHVDPPGRHLIRLTKGLDPGDG